MIARAIVGAIVSVLILGLTPLPVQASPTSTVVAVQSADVEYVNKCKYQNETVKVERFRYTNLRFGKLYGQVCYRKIKSANRTVIYAVKVTEAGRFNSSAWVQYFRLDVQNMLPDNQSSSTMRNFQANRWVLLETPITCYGLSCVTSLHAVVDVPKRIRNVKIQANQVAVG